MSTTTQPTLPTMTLQQPPFDFRFDRTKGGWELVENIALEGEPTMSLDTFFAEGESYVVGNTMVERGKEGAEEKGALAGQLHAERMLGQQENIPAEWRRFYLVFGGTVWRNPEGNLYVAYLFWYDGEWNLSWSWLGNDLGSGNCLVRVGK